MNRDKEALEDLISSDGWAIYQRLIRERYGDDTFKIKLRQIGNETTDLAITGAKMGQMLVAHEVAEELSVLPYHHIAYLESLEERKNETDRR
jgi:hypothetical protein